MIKSIERKQKTILVLEDEASLLRIIREKLERNGFSVLTARSNEEAETRLKEAGGADLIWIDHYLLGKGLGLDFVLKLKKGPAELKKIPVFVVANVLTEEELKKYLELGVDKYYLKADSTLAKILSDIKKFLN